MSELSDRLVLINIENSFPPQVVRRAMQLYQEEAVEDLEVSEEILSGLVLDREYEYEPAFHMEGDRFFVKCTCRHSGNSPCVHVIALLIAWIAEQRGEEALPLFLGEAAPAADNIGLVASAGSPAMQAEGIRSNLLELVGLLNVKQMREIASHRGIPLSGMRREAILDMLVDGLASSENFSRAVGALPADSRRVADYLASLSPKLPGSLFIEDIQAALEAALADWPPSRPASECLEDLRQRGLAFFQGSFVRLPLQLLTFQDVNPQLFKLAPVNPGRVEAAQPFGFTRMALRILLLGQAGYLECEPSPGKPQQGGWLPSAGGTPLGPEKPVPPEPIYLRGDIRERVARAAAQPEERIDFIARVLASGKFWEARQPQRLTGRFLRWLQQSPGEQSRELLQLALDLRTTAELDSARKIQRFEVARNAQINLSRNDFLRGLSQARRWLFQLLSRAPAGEWLEIASILKTIYSLDPYWLPGYYGGKADARQTWGATRSLTLTVNHKKVDPHQFEAWRETYGQVYRMMLTETFHALGLLDIAWQGQHPAACRITPFGEYLLGRRAEFSMPAAAHPLPAFRITKDGNIELDPEQASPEMINLIFLIGDPLKKASAPNLAVPMHLTYRISIPGLGQAFAAGWDFARLKDMLERGLLAPLPQTIAQPLAKIWERYGRLHLYTHMALIQFGDDYALPELLAATSLGQVLLYTFSPRVVAIRPEAVEPFMQELRVKGYTPRLEAAAHA